MKLRDKLFGLPITLTGLINEKNAFHFPHQILNNMHAFVVIFDMEKRLPVWINKYAETRLGYSITELKNAGCKKILALIHPCSRKILTNLISDNGNNSISDDKAVYQIRDINRQWIQVLISTNVLKYTPGGKIKYMIGFGFEITQDELKGIFNKIEPVHSDCADSDKNKKLSKRELEITRYIADSMTDKEIAAELNISINTTKTHRKRIINKLGLKNTASLVKYSIENGLVSIRQF